MAFCVSQQSGKCTSLGEHDTGTSYLEYLLSCYVAQGGLKQQCAQLVPSGWGKRGDAGGGVRCWEHINPPSWGRALGKAAALLFLRTEYEQTGQNQRGAPVRLFFMCDIKTRPRAAVVSEAPAAVVQESRR